MRSWYILHARGMFVKAFSMCTVPSSQVFSFLTNFSMVVAWVRFLARGKYLHSILWLDGAFYKRTMEIFQKSYSDFNEKVKIELNFF